MMDSLVTVTVAAATRALTTAASLRAELGVSDSTLPDARAGNLIARASKAAESYCGRVFARETLSQVFRWSAAWSCRPYEQRKMLALARYPVSSISSVTEDGTALTAADYEADAETGRLYRLSSDARVAWCAQKTTVVYVAGYVLPGDSGTRTLPEGIEAAAIKLAATLYHGASRDPSIKGESADGIGSVDYWVGSVPGAAGELPPDVTALLDPWRTVIV